MATKFDKIRTHVMDCVKVLFEGMQYDVLRTVPRNFVFRL